MKNEAEHWLKPFLVEVLVYGALVIGYVLLVLRVLGGWLDRLSSSHRPVYAVVALALVICQGFVLEAVTRFLLEFIKPRTEDG
ncbi:conserved hypothetical protein [Verrucomicrobia bacterium]|nr:conserved hypothetical protein [Verrucomicrobiota bacterium]